MHIRASQLDIFGSACTFDASGTLAGAAFEHIERIGADLAGICVVMRRIMGKFYKAKARYHCRRDGQYQCFDLPDGSVLSVDFAQRPGAWLVAVESRTAWELLQGRDMTLLPFALCAFDQSGSIAADAAADFLWENRA